MALPSNIQQTADTGDPSRAELVRAQCARTNPNRTEWVTRNSVALAHRDAQLTIRKLAQIVAWGLATGIVVLSLVPPGFRPQTVAPHHLEHLAIFAATGFAFGLGFDQKRSLLAIYLVVFAGSVEFLQLFAPGRHARLSDFIVDASSIFGGLITEALIDRIYSRYGRT